MDYCLIVCRSLTYAQQTEKILEKAGISAYVIRSPKGVDREGCGYSVKIKDYYLWNALNQLKMIGQPFLKVYRLHDDNSIEEVKI